MLVSYDILPGDALAFIYQADRAMTPDESREITGKLQAFVSQWTSHQLPVPGYGEVVHDRFVVLFADESADKIGGCSKDKVSQFIRDLGAAYGIDFFNRLLVAYVSADAGIDTVHLSDLGASLEKGRLQAGTPVFNNLVSTKKQWEQAWQQPLADSPFSRFAAQKAD